MRVELEEEHALRRLEARRASRRGARAGSPAASRRRGARGAAPRPAPSSREVDERVGAEEEHRVVPLGMVAQQVDRAGVLVEDDLVVRERGARELEPRRRRASRSACARGRPRRGRARGRARARPSRRGRARRDRRAAGRTRRRRARSAAHGGELEALLADLDLGAVAGAGGAEGALELLLARRRADDAEAAVGAQAAATARAFGSGR